MDKKKHEKYAVGYQKPPRDTQFKPGKSGNPNGRPKKVATVGEILSKQLRARVPIIRNGKRQTIPVIEGILKQQLNKALAGDLKAATLILNQLPNEDTPGASNHLGDLVQEFRALYAFRVAGDNDGGSDK